MQGRKYMYMKFPPKFQFLVETDIYIYIYRKNRFCQNVMELSINIDIDSNIIIGKKTNAICTKYRDIYVRKILEILAEIESKFWI